MPCGGWCPKGRKAEDGRIPCHYPLTETESGRYAERTLRNVQASDGTLVLAGGIPTGGTATTIGMARKEGKPFLVMDLDSPADTQEAAGWIAREGICVLNIAGPRESGSPGIYDTALRFLRRLLD